MLTKKPAGGFGGDIQKRKFSSRIEQESYGAGQPRKTRPSRRPPAVATFVLKTDRGAELYDRYQRAEPRIRNDDAVGEAG